jgi:hypothetical protein
MTGETHLFEAYVDAWASVLGFSLEPSWKPAVAANVETILKMAALVEGHALPDDIEPAPVFEA